MPKLPITLNFDLNDGCNLVCRMCGGRRKPSEQKYIPLHQFKERIIPLFPHLTAFQFGCQFEPLLLPYFNAAVRMIDQNTPLGTEGALVTNGTLLTEQAARTLLEASVFKRIRISWDASHRDLFQSIRCGADFNRLLENLKRLIALKKSTGSSASIEFNTTILPENISDLPSILDLAGQLGVNRVTTNKLFPDDQLYVTESYAEILADNMARAAEVAKAHDVAFEGQTYRTFEKYQAINSQSFDGYSKAGRCSFHTSQRLELIMEPSGCLHSPCRRIQFPLCNVLNDDLAAMIEIGLIPLLESIFSSTDERCLGCHLLSVQSSIDEPTQLVAKVQDPQPVEDCLQMQERNEPITNRMAAGQESSQHEEQPTMAFTSELNHVIPPEIKDDEFYEIIQQLSRQADIKTVLEIGSSAGGGSTEAFVTGLRKNPNTTKLFCMEVSVPRFQQLKSRYQEDSFVQCYNVSSVPISCFPSERELELFYNFIPTALNNYPLEQVIGWLRQDIDYIRQTNVPENGIQLIKREHNIETFDMVLIDGSEFLGKAELEEVYGARIILLDDINGFKNYHNRQRLLADPCYQLIHENFPLRNGYSVFRRKTDEILPIHFFTIVLNGEPFIRHHIDVFKQLPFGWHWHVVEGVADLVHDTAWSIGNGGRITDEFHTDGLSNDGTSAYLDELKSRFPDQVTIYRKPSGAFWNGKLEMVNAPLANIHEECLLWQVDSDELWTTEPVGKLRSLFLKQPEKTAAYLYCDYFVGPHKYVSSLNTWATNPCDWLRVWRYRPGMIWNAHEPPVLVNEAGQNVASLSPFSRDETVAGGITFQHFAYTIESQVRFKEIYYGYSNAVACWQRLQKTSGPVKAADYLPWALPDAVVEEWPASAAPHLAEHFFAPLTPPAEQYVSMSVHGATRFEHELRGLFRTLRPQTVIETGTFLGQGTTSIIWRAVRALGLTTNITTIEVNPEHHRLACEHFKANGMTVRAELGLSIPRSKLPDMAAITEEFVVEADSCNGRIYYDHDEVSRATRYFSETAFDVPENLLEAALARCNYRPDFVLLDSAGHIGFAEFQHLLTLLKGSCHLMLDDINHCKHARTMKEIRRDPRFEVLVESDEKFGFAIVRYTHVERLIYLRTDAIGDNVLSAGMLPHIRGQYPGAILTVVCQDRVAQLYDACPFVDGVISFDYNRFIMQPVYRQLIIDKMNSLQPTLILNPIYSHDLHDEFIAHHCQAPLKVACQGDASNRDQGKLDEMSVLYSFLVPNDPADLTELDRHHTFLQGIGVNAPAMMPQVWTSPGDEAWADELLKQHGIAAGQAIILFPGALLDCKMYPHYDKVLENLRDFPLIVVGGAELRERGEQLSRAHGDQAINLAGQTTLGQMAALMRRGRLYLGSDSSGMHVACAVGLKNVVLLGGGHFGRFCPYSPLTTAVCLPLSCYHCNWQCRYQRVHCLHDVAPKTVIDAIGHALNDSNASEKPRLHIQQNSCHVDTPPILAGETLFARLFLDRFSSNLL